jgi:hypothetical protein
LPPKTFAVFGMSVGYPDPQVNAVIKPRLSQTAILHREQYQSDPQDQAIAEYNSIMNDFYSSQNMNNQGKWSEHSSKRIVTKESLSGRDRLRTVLNKLGFRLY